MPEELTVTMGNAAASRGYSRLSLIACCMYKPERNPAHHIVNASEAILFHLTKNAHLHITR